MIPEINNSKEIIRNRMLKHALNYWDIKSTDELDPAVKRIMEALSTELHNLGNEIKDTQIRMLEKIASLLAPDFLTYPNPAHAILHATPTDPTELLSNTSSFIVQHEISSKQNGVFDAILDIFFTPVDAIKVFDVQIAYLSTGGNVFSYDTSFTKQFKMSSKRGRSENNTMWLGLRINPKIEDIRGLFFYFDWKNLDSKRAQHICQLLPLTKWFIDDQQIETTSGLKYTIPQEESTGYENIFFEYDLLSLMEKDIKQYYNQKFITVDSTGLNKINELKRSYPPSFKNVFTENDLQKMNEKLLWVKIVFPAATQQEFLDEVYIYPNAFPVMNRQVNDLKSRLKGGSNIIPLKTGEFDQFLSVKSLTDEVHQYKSVPYRKMEEEQSGTYTLRNGGVERFDGRNARELISYLLELLRSESAAFAAYGYDFIAATLKEMNQKISLMEQKTKGYINSAAEVPNYIIVKPFEGQDMMYAEYWTTHAGLANNIRPGTGKKPQLHKGAKVKQDSVMLLTSTIGGKNKLRPEERLNAFQYAIMTRNRIITKEDIRNFCFYELGERISKVEVERGFEMSADSKEAFRRTIDVVLTPLESGALKSKEWELLCEQLKSKLHTRSGMSNYYRILLQKSEP